MTTFWKEIETWLQSIVAPHIKLGDVEQFFGWNSSENFINRTIIATIQTIYKNRKLGKKIFVMDVKHLFANQMFLEEYLANMKYSEDQFDKVLGVVYQNLQNA